MIRGALERFTVIIALILWAAMGPLPLRAHSDLRPCKIAGHRVLETDFNGIARLIYPWVNVVFQDLEGRYWMGTDKGLNEYDEKRGLWTTVKAKDGQLLETDVAMIAQSNDHKLWFASRPKTSFHGFGVLCFDGREWRQVDARNSMLKYPNSDRTLPVHTMFAGQNGKLWFGVDDGSVTFDGGTWTPRMKLSTALNRHSVGTIDAGIQDSEGDVWLGGALLGIIRFDERRKRWTTYNPMLVNTDVVRDDFDDFRSIKATSISCIYEDRSRRMWFAAGDGYVYIYDREKDSWKSLDLSEHFAAAPAPSTPLLPQASIMTWSIYQDRFGRMMFATNKGLLTYEEDLDQWDLYTPKNSCLPSEIIYSIAEDKAGRVWLGTKGLVLLE